MLLTTTSTLQDRHIDEYKGVVSGEAILGANAFRDMFAGIRDFSGGRSSLRPPGPVADGRPASPAETQKGQGHHSRRATSARVLPAAGTPGCRPACNLRPGGRE